MRRLAVLAVSALLLLAPTVANAATAAATTPASRPVAGTYKLFYNWSQTGFSHSPMTLNADGTGSDKAGHPITWSMSGKSLTLLLNDPPSGVTTYLGTKSRAGFDTRRHPGTMSSNQGFAGVWYAVKTG